MRVLQYKREGALYQQNKCPNSHIRCCYCDSTGKNKKGVRLEPVRKK